MEGAIARWRRARSIEGLLDRDYFTGRDSWVSPSCVRDLAHAGRFRVRGGNFMSHDSRIERVTGEYTRVAETRRDASGEMFYT